MTFLLLGFAIIAGFSFRDILQKHTAPHYNNHYEAGGIPAIFTCIAVVLLAPILTKLWHPNHISYIFWQPFWQTLLNSEAPRIIIIWAILVGIIKGIVVFLFNSGARNLDLSSVSGSTYLAFVSIGLGSIINFFIFNEAINIFPIIIIFVFAVLFYAIGPGRVLISSKKTKTLFFCIFGLATLVCLDYVGIRSSNWFFHLALSNAVSLVFFLFLIRKNIINNFSFLTNPLILLSGLIYAAMEFIFVFSFSILGVSYAFLLGMMSYLPTMLIGSLKYGEGKWYIQGSFAAIAIACIYVIAMG